MKVAEQPSITIITVVYNNAKALEQTINNIKSIAYANLKFIVIDGGSTDGTRDVITKYSNNITAYLSEPDQGVYDAMNKGWKIADERSYILFLGAGDKVLSLPENLSSDYNEVVYGKVYKGEYLFPSVHNFKLRLGNTLHHQALLIPKKLHVEPPFDTTFKLYADFDFNQRLDKQKVNFRHSHAFKSYAEPGGISEVRDDKQMLSVVKKNYGSLMYCLALTYYTLQNIKAKVSSK